MSSLQEMLERVEWSGGDSDGRNCKHKLDSMKASLWNSYQAEWITLDDRWRDDELEPLENQKCRCLINPEKLDANIDQKVISIEFDAGMRPGDTFYWTRTGKHWIACDYYDNEEAYFRARIRKCDYSITVNDNVYWVWLRGPEETNTEWFQKQSIISNKLNYDLAFYVTKNAETSEFFQRHQKMKFEGHNWTVAAVDRYSQDYLLEVFLAEAKDNEMEDAMVQEEEIEPDVTKPYIDGEQFIRAYDTGKVYTVVGSNGGTFSVNSSKVKIVSYTDTTCTIDVITGRATEFDLTYSVNGQDDVTLSVKVKSL